MFKQRQRGQKHPAIRWFIAGFVSIVFVGGVFFAGYQTGNGSWNINFGRSVAPSNKSLPSRLDYDAVNEVYQALKKQYDGQLDVNKLIDGLRKGMVNAASDPYTTYFSKQEAKDFNEELNGSFSGIGAELGKQDINPVIIAPIAGSPAEKAGLKAKDVIVSIDNQDAAGLSVDEAVKRIRGDKGTSVKLTILRNNKDLLDFTIVRDTITIPSVTSKILDGNIGYIDITRFAEDTSGLVDNAAKDFKSKNIKGIILDLRNNPGGYLNAAVQVSGQWLKSGQLIVQEKRSGRVIESYSAETDGQLIGMPTIVLINEGSASASEITTGALKDNNAAKIVGTKSYGKGSVQEIVNFSGGDALKVTVARWYTPLGKNIDKEGILPDTEVKITDANIKAGVDTQLNKALDLLK